MSLLDKQARQYDNASTQINVPPEIADQIKQIGQELIPDEHLEGDGRVELIHVTVKYGVRPDKAALERAVAGFKPFEVSMGKIVVFTDAEDDGVPVVIEVHGHGFDELHKAVADTMGILPDDFAYTPHITIAYVKEEEAQHYAGNDAFAGIKFTAEAVTLSMFEDGNEVDVPLKTAASPAVMPELPEVAPQYEREQPEEEEVQRDELATQEQPEEEEQPQPQKRQRKSPLLQKKQPKPKPFKAPKPPAENRNFKRWFGKSKVRDEDGNPMVVYHGTTHDFEEFDTRKTHQENYYGKGLYFTSSHEDLGNYATHEGPDLTSRVEGRVEEIMREWEDQWDDVKDDLGFGDLEMFPDYNAGGHDAVKEKAEQEARNELVGTTQGMSMPVYLSIQNPVIVQKRGGTEFELNVDEDGNESGSGFDLYNAMWRVQGGYDMDVDKIWQSVAENMEFNAWDFEETVREKGDVQNDQGNYVSGSFISDVYQELGFDGIILDANAAFGRNQYGGGMKMDYDTKHYIIWDETKVKSAIGNTGKYDPKNRNITASKSLSMYHGTNKRIPPTHNEIYLAEEPDDAQQYGKNLFRAVVTPKNIFDVANSKHRQLLPEVLEALLLDQKGLSSDDAASNIGVHYRYLVDYPEILDTLRARGFDAVWVDEPIASDGHSLLALDPSIIQWKGKWNGKKFAAKRKLPIDDLPAAVKADLVEEVAEHMNKIGFEAPWGGEVYANDLRGELFDLVEPPMITVYDASVEKLYAEMKRKNSPAAVKKYVEMLKSGMEFDPIFVFNGKFHDGGHRLEAYHLAGRKTIPVAEIAPLLAPAEFWNRWFADDPNAKFAAIKTWWHVSPVMNRGSIQAKGLKVPKAEDRMFYADTPPGIYVFPSEQQAKAWAYDHWHSFDYADRGLDLWKVRIDSKLMHDDTHPESKGAFYSLENVPATNVKLESYLLEDGTEYEPSPDDGHFDEDDVEYLDEKTGAGEKSVGDLGLAKRIMHELMPVLGVELPEPEIKIVNSPRSGFLGQDVWRVGVNNATLYGKDNTIMELQRSILKDETTLRRIIAHELCHHADNLVNGSKLIEKFQGTGERGYRMVMNELRQTAHGKGWKEFVQKYNAKFGADFVSEKSDENLVIDRQPVKPYYIALHKQPNGKIYFASASRLGPAALKHLWYKRTHPDETERFTTTDDQLFVRGAGIGNGWAVPKADAADMQTKLQELWDKAGTETPMELPNPWVKETKGGPVPDADMLKKYLERDGKEIMVKPTENKALAGWVDVWSRYKAAGKRDEETTSMTVGTTDPNFPIPVLIRWEQGMRWRQVLRTVKSIVGEIAGKRVPWRDIHIWGSLWDNRKAQDEGWEKEKGSKIMYDILHNGTYVRVDHKWTKPVALGSTDKEATSEEKAPSTLYHATDAEFREEVLRDGLDPMKYDNKGIFFRTVPKSGIPPKSSYFDVWAVNVDGLDVEPDTTTTLHPDEHEEYGAPWWVYWGPEPIEPERLKLHYEGKQPGKIADSHKVTPLDDTYYNNPEIGEETNAYAEIPERVRGTYDTPPLKTLAPQLFEKAGAGVTFRTEFRGSSHGQNDLSLIAEVGGKPVGYVDYSVYNGEPSVKFVEAFDKRQGYGTALFKKLQSMFPDTEINLGGTTPEGTKLVDSLNFREEPTEHADKFTELETLTKERDRLQAIADEFYAEGGHTNEQKQVFIQQMEEMNKIHDRIWELEQETNNQAPSKRLISSFDNPLLKSAVYGEQQNSVQHTDHQAVGLTKTLNSNPFADEMEALKGENQVELNPGLEDEIKSEGQRPAKGEEQMEAQQAQKFQQASKKALTLSPEPDNVKAALAEIAESFAINPLNSREYIIMEGETPIAVFEIASRSGKLRLKGIRSLEQGKGHGSAALRTILAIADKHGVEMELTASPFGDEKARLDSDELKAWYRRHQFEDEPGHDPSLGYMVRKPKTSAEKWDQPVMDVHGSGGVMWIDMFSIPEAWRGKGHGAKVYRDWEAELPKNFKLVRLYAGDTGAGPSNGFWEKMGFSYVYDTEQGDETDNYMWKGVNGAPTPQPLKSERDQEGYDIEDEPENA